MGGSEKERGRGRGGEKETELVREKGGEQILLRRQFLDYVLRNGRKRMTILCNAFCFSETHTGTEILR